MLHFSYWIVAVLESLSLISFYVRVAAHGAKWQEVIHVANWAGVVALQLY